MIVKIGHYVLTKIEKATVNLSFDQIADTFRITAYFDPSSKNDKEMFLPCKFLPVYIDDDNGNRILTGVLLKHKFTSTTTKKLVTLEGYSAAGVLEDCATFSINTGLSLIEITKKLVADYGLDLYPDDNILLEASKIENVSDADASQTVKSLICGLASQRHIIVSKTRYGSLRFTRGHTDKTPLYNFNSANGIAPATKMELDVNGQMMHNKIEIVRQHNIATPVNSSMNYTITNPYLNIEQQLYLNTDLMFPLYNTNNRPTVVKQSASTVNFDDQLAGRNALARELRAIRLTIEMEGHTLGGKLVEPDNLITVRDPELYLYESTKFFIESVTLEQDKTVQTATLTCVVPEVYNNETPKNIFTGNYAAGQKYDVHVVQKADK